MEILLQIILLIVGFVLLIKGADVFVDGSSGVATRFGMPKILIGLTIVAFGTSAPEFAVSVKSLLAGTGDMMLGNVVGSNILNVLLILGAASLIRPLPVKNSTLKKEIPIMILLTVMLAILMCDVLLQAGDHNSFTRQDGAVLVVAFSIFMYYLIATTRRRIRKNKEEAAEKKEESKVLEAETESTKEDSEDKPPMKLWKAVLFVVIGIAGIIIGSNCVVDSASKIASIIGISDAIIALTVVALGTSLPELVTSIIAARKNECDIAIGNVVGSNIFNIGIVAGVPVFAIGGISSFSFSYIDAAVMLLSTVLLFFFTWKDRRIGRKEGAIFLAIFIAYYSYVIINGLN
ncbi:MAG: calcium/sodium antiporter [Candidatus Saccharibacteria bacterium]|nr:calcium/sodium antiporter [Candidatus Saccharibacteria bacterium]